MAFDPKQVILAAARDRDLERPLRAAQYAVAGREARRNFRDDTSLKLALSLTLPVDASCVDVGANVGSILDAIVRAAPRGQHIAYEPLPDLASDLRRRFPRVDVRNAALADTPGERRFTRVVNAHSRSGFHDGGYKDSSARTEALIVRVEQLDTALPTGFAPALIKVDVEGAELEVLCGAMRTISDHRPLVALEHGGPAPASGEIYRLLCGEAGLRCSDLDGRTLDLRAFLDELAVGRRWNFLFHR